MLTKKEFAAKVGRNTRWLAVYIKNGKVVLSEDPDFIDPEQGANAVFLERHAHRADGVKANKPKAAPAGFSKKQKALVEEIVAWDESSEDEDPDGIPGIVKSERAYKHALAIKTTREGELKKLQIDKIKGHVIPSGLIMPVILQHNQSMLAAQVNADEEMLTYVAQKAGLGSDAMAHMRGEWAAQRNAAIKAATQETIDKIDDIVDDFAATKGVGERN